MDQEKGDLIKKILEQESEFKGLIDQNMELGNDNQSLKEEIEIFDAYLDSILNELQRIDPNNISLAQKRIVK